MTEYHMETLHRKCLAVEIFTLFNPLNKVKILVAKKAYDSKQLMFRHLDISSLDKLDT